MRTRLNRLFREEHGVVAPLVALMLVAFIGMAALTIDVGRLYAQRADLQHSMDAAALAGATAFIRGSLEGEALPENKAKAAAETVAGANGDSGAKAEVLPGSTAHDARIRVSSSRPTDLYFARVLKLFSVDVGAQSIARAWRAKGVHSKGNLIPLGLDTSWATEDKINTEVVLKVLGNMNIKGNFYCLDFGPKGEGANEYREHCKNGYPESMYEGDIIPTEPGNMIGPTEQGLSDRVGDTVLVPIVDFSKVQGCTDVTVRGFASVRITEVKEVKAIDEEGKEKWQTHVKGIFTGLTSEGRDESVETGGIWSYKLVKN